MSDWQPIETAPKGVDHKACLVWCADNRCTYTAWWNGESWDYFCGGGEARVIDRDITHWMPLPEPPSVDAVAAPMDPPASVHSREKEKS